MMATSGGMGVAKGGDERMQRMRKLIRKEEGREEWGERARERD